MTTHPYAGPVDHQADHHRWRWCAGAGGGRQHLFRVSFAGPDDRWRPDSLCERAHGGDHAGVGTGDIRPSKRKKCALCLTVENTVTVLP